MKTSYHLPISYYGELHDVHLINFSVDLHEIKTLLPGGLQPLQIRPGRCLISMVNVDLQRMRPFYSWFPGRFRYRHIAFRLLTDDRFIAQGKNRGIYFLQSFTNKRWVASAGSRLTIFRLRTARITYNAARTSFRLQHGDHSVHYSIQPGEIANGTDAVKGWIQSLDRAYYAHGEETRYVKICREQWPLVPVTCTDFQTNFFPSARLEGAFVVPQTIYYHWERPHAEARIGATESAVMYW